MSPLPPPGDVAATPGEAKQKAAVRKSPEMVEGIVTSAKMQKTIAIEVERFERHPKYLKYIRRLTRYKAHDENGEAKEGDRVRIAWTRPLSKTKHWRLVAVISKAKQ